MSDKRSENEANTGFSPEFFRQILLMICADVEDYSPAGEHLATRPNLDSFYLTEARHEVMDSIPEISLVFTRRSDPSSSIRLRVRTAEAESLVEREPNLRHEGNSLAEDAAAFYATMIEEVLETRPDEGAEVCL